MPGSRGGGGRAPLPRNVQVSKKIAWLLRHGAEKEGLQLDSAGFVNVSDILANRNLRSLKVTFDELRQIVQDNDKQRFSMVPIDQAAQDANANDTATNISQPPLSDNPKDYLIRANQGHSLKLDSDGLLQPITAETIPETAVHGTTHANWLLISASGGLKPMTRNHVHFATGLPAGFQSVVEQDKDTVDAPVISGMRKSSTVLVYLDVPKAMDAGIKFWRSENGVILTEGDESGIVPLAFFKRVEDRTGEGVLVQDGEVVKDAPAKWARKER